MKRGLSVIIVCAQAYVRSALRMHLEGAGITVINDHASSTTALRDIRAQRPDVVLCESRLDAINGIELWAKVCRAQPDTKVVVLSDINAGPLPARVMEAGASAYLDINCPVEEVIRVLHRVNRGEIYLSRTVAQHLALSRGRDSDNRLACLSRRELEVALLLARGYRLQGIAELLSLSVKTVSTHKSRLFTKLDVNNVPRLVATLRDNGHEVTPI